MYTYMSNMFDLYHVKGYLPYLATHLLGIPAAVCLDRIGAAAIANCREKLGWPDTQIECLYTVFHIMRTLK